MSAPRVLVVAETPSLARSLSYLLEAAGIVTDTVASLDTQGATPAASSRPPLIIAASSGPYCATARRWVQGSHPDSELIVIGSRDPTLAAMPTIRQVNLPLRPDELLELVRERLGLVTAPQVHIT